MVFSHPRRQKGFLTINKGGISSLKDADFELIVTESSLTESQKEYKYIQMLELGKFIPIVQELPTYTEFLLKYNPDISTKDRNQLLKEFKQLIQSRAEQAQVEGEREDKKIKQQGDDNIRKTQLEILKLSNEGKN